MADGRRGSIRKAWRIARPYWSSEERWAARGLLAVVVAMSLGQVWINVQFNTWRKTFYNALQNYDEHVFLVQLGVFTALAFGWIILGVYQTYLQQMLQIRWRRWLTDRYLHAWLGDQAYYRMQLTGSGTDNPDQRISDDLNFFTDQSLSLSLGLLANFVQVVSFSFILWDLSGAFAIPLGVWGSLSIPGYMFWAALIYTAIGTWLTVRVGSPLVRLNFNQQRFEADLRFSLVRLRENAESVAFFGGEGREYETFWGRFGHVFDNFWAIMVRTKLLNWFTSGYGQAAIIFPYLVAAPRYFSKSLDFGGLMQTAGAFITFQSSLSFFVNAYSSIANWQSIVDRLSGFTDRIESIEAAQRGPQPIAITRAGGGVAVGALDLDLPDGKSLLDGIRFEVGPGQSLLITGPTGTGKSTLLRALAGLWPFGSGTVRLGAGRAFFLPQKAYIPLGTLRQALAYPDDGTAIPEERLRTVLGAVGLGHLADELDRDEMWAHRLSGGEQQRLAFARILLAEPATIFLDEATAALDEAGEAALYRMLRELPWRPAIVSVGHRSTLRAFHDRAFDLAAAPAPAAAPGD